MKYFEYKQIGNSYKLGGLLPCTSAPNGFTRGIYPYTKKTENADGVIVAKNKSDAECMLKYFETRVNLIKHTHN